jgi:hypothetical protein
MPNLYSPEGRNPLVVLEGSHSDIWTRGDQLVTLGGQMDRTATSLKLISDGTTQISEAVDKVRETAGEVHGDLTKAATRYADTGAVLRTYADALEAAQNRLTPLVEEIEEKSLAVKTAQDDENSARAKVNDYDTTWIWETEATDTQKTAAATALSEAESAASTAEGDLDGLWDTYDTHFGIWSDAYDSAVSGIHDAIEAADNNDFWLDDAADILLDVLGAVAIVLVVVALFVAAPLAAVLLAVVAVISVISLIATIYKAARGNANAVDVAIAVVGIIPFAKPAMVALKAGGRFTTVAKTFTRLMDSAGAQNAMGIARSKLTNIMLHGVRGSGAQTAIRNSIPGLLKAPYSAATAWGRLRAGSPSGGDLLVMTNHIRQTIPGMAPWFRNSTVLAATPSGGAMVHNVVSFFIGPDRVDKWAQQVSPAYAEFRETY